ncbi:MAG: hypothetical protein EXR50_06880, partial [Dehalococcoidia bacterium]|nr:hypothetical protein [Dehalococcoidia bacterium]
MTSERAQRRIERFLDEADEAMSQSDWTAVKDRARNVLALDPENPDGLTYMAAAERVLGAPEPATPSDAPARDPDQTQPQGAARAMPVSFVNGRYVVKRFLGEGGKKIVYETNDNVLDRDVAYAEIKTDGLDEVGRERIKREGQTLGRLGSHPNIVSVHDLGEEN